VLAGRGTHPLREVVLVMTMVDHGGLIHGHLDDFAAVELSHPDLLALRAAILAMVAAEPEADFAHLRETLASGRFGPLIARLDAQVRACGYWPAMASASDGDAAEGWLQALTLHRRQRTLHKDLKDAEAALGSEPSEANLARLVDIQKQMASTEGTEALIEGFGSSSGRDRRAF
jgi:DNA primase